MRRTLAIAATAALAGCTTTSSSYVPTSYAKAPVEQADAYCNLYAMGSKRGHIAFGSAEFVAGAAIGNAIGGAIRQARVKNECMKLMGFKHAKPAS